MPGVVIKGVEEVVDKKGSHKKHTISQIRHLQEEDISQVFLGYHIRDNYKIEANVKENIGLAVFRV